MDMERPSDLHLSRPGFLAEVTLALLYIRDTRASGRLSIRNGERFGLVHLYFSAARLIHVTGNKCDGEAILHDLLTWSKGSVRFEAVMMVNYESMTWQQAQVFTRWLEFLEMRGMVHGIPRARLDGFARSLTLNLPVQPIALPEEVEHYEQNEEIAPGRQLQRLNEGVQYLIERTVPGEQRQQLRRVSQRLNGVVQQAGDATQELAKRATRATKESVLQAAEAAQEAARQGGLRAEGLMRQAFNRDHPQHFVQSTHHTAETVVMQAAEAAQEMAWRSALRAEELMRQAFNEDRRQQIIQSVQDTVESVKQTISQTMDQGVEDASPLPPELRARSIRPMRSLRSPSPATGGWGDG